MFAGDLVKQR